MGRFWVFCVLSIFCIGFSGASQNIVNDYADSLVTIKEVDEGSMKGSGFVYSSDGYIIKNNHIAVENGVEQDLEVKFDLSDEWTRAETVGRDPETDLAVLKVNELPEEVESLQISNSAIQEGQEVTILGNLPGVEGLRIKGEIVGINKTVSTKEGVVIHKSVIIAADIEPGNSGGPVLNTNKEVIGVISARNKAERIGFAIPAFAIRDTMPRLIQNQTFSP